MKLIKNYILKHSPIFIQNFFISLYNTYLYYIRHKGKYSFYRKYYEYYDIASYNEVLEEQSRRQKHFLNHTTKSSKWYSKFEGQSLKAFPILNKHDLVNNLSDITTITEDKAVVSYTGGTTGASLKVFYSHEDTQERQALLDHFRSKFGYKIGKKTAWFSGKSIVRIQDLANGNCWRDDYINNIRFFSTFHISSKNIELYWDGLNSFLPEFIVGFPSSIYDICVMALEEGYEYTGQVKVFFPTAETLLPHQARVIRRVLKCEIRNQYASSEGAPFILECVSGNMHVHPLSGIIEVLDAKMNNSNEGEMIVTSFTTSGTPLVRYRIGDSLRFSDENFVCACGSSFQLVDMIFGRTNDFVWSPENGRVNLGNLSNCTKDVKGILQFQIIQKTINSLDLLLMISEGFDSKELEKFVAALRERLGSSMKIECEIVEDIPRESSGKFRLVKNTIDPKLFGNNLPT